MACVWLGLQITVNCKKTLLHSAWLWLAEVGQMKPSDIIHTFRPGEPFTHCLENLLKNGVKPATVRFTLPFKTGFLVSVVFDRGKSKFKRLLICLLPFCIPLLIGIP